MAADNSKPVAQLIECLMVNAVALRRSFGTHRLGDAGAGIEIDSGEAVPVIFAPDVLHQRATEGDVEHLHPTADREDRLVGVDGRGDHRQLHLVVLGNDAVQRFLRCRLAVPTRIDVATTVEHDGIDASEEIGDVVDQPADRWQHQRCPAGPLHGSEVRLAGREGLATNTLCLVRLAADDDDEGIHCRPALRTSSS